MNISKIQTTPNFYNTQKPQKREFIDIISDNVRNPRDVNDCVAVPRGIFEMFITYILNPVKKFFAIFINQLLLHQLCLIIF